MPIYKQMTVRNWNTTTKLLSLMEQGSGISASAFRAEVVASSER